MIKGKNPQHSRSRTKESLQKYSTENKNSEVSRKKSEPHIHGFLPVCSLTWLQA